MIDLLNAIPDNLTTEGLILIIFYIAYKEYKEYKEKK